LYIKKEGCDEGAAVFQVTFPRSGPRDGSIACRNCIWKYSLEINLSEVKKAALAGKDLIHNVVATEASAGPVEVLRLE
jgi:hypothetical protein